eukprot:gene10008-biopygen1724
MRNNITIGGPTFPWHTLSELRVWGNWIVFEPELRAAYNFSDLGSFLRLYCEESRSTPPAGIGVILLCPQRGDDTGGVHTLLPQNDRQTITVSREKPSEFNGGTNPPRGPGGPGGPGGRIIKGGAPPPCPVAEAEQKMDTNEPPRLISITEPARP